MHGAGHVKSAPSTYLAENRAGIVASGHCPLAVLQMVARYQNLLHGAEPVESALSTCFQEYFNAEIALRTIRDVSLGIDWLKSTFFFVRVGWRCSTTPGLVAPAVAAPASIAREANDCCAVCLH